MEVLGYTEHEDGSATFDLELSDEEREILKEKLEVEQLTDEDIQKWFIEAIENGELPNME